MGYIDEMMGCQPIPGGFLTVVKGQDVIFKQSFGVRDADKGLKVNNQTLFGIGSTSKAFTTTMFGMLKDQGLVDWDSKMEDLSPHFRLKDSSASARVKARDLLCHRTGVPRNDASWMFGTQFDTAAERLENIRSYDLNYDLREKWQYSNWMFSTIGTVEEEITGKSWEDLLHELILDPLGMKSTVAGFNRAAEKTDNVAIPAVRGKDDDSYVNASWDFNRNIDAVAPAGAINTNADDIAEWLKLNIAMGERDGKTLIKKETLKEMWTSQAVMVPTGAMVSMGKPIFPEGIAASPNYGLGWMIGMYRGINYIFHGGSTFGHNTLTVILPEYQLGMTVSVNTWSELSSVTCNMLLYRTIDAVLDLDEWLDKDSMCTFPCKWVPQAPQCQHDNTARKLGEEDPDADADAGVEVEAASKDTNLFGFRVQADSDALVSVDTSEYVGCYRHAGYGAMQVSDVDGALAFTFNQMEGECDHLNHDAFMCKERMYPKGSPMQPELKSPIQFTRNVKGEIAALVWGLVLDVPYNLVFRPVAQAECDALYA
eukprot:GFYU01006574.1.p1 GENE.GFYU01006574.1~~GFYU01006574.1.p1  ORF type:complete len:540 (+),score=147.68 GFYU01006574.1:1-1620(+)